VEERGTSHLTAATVPISAGPVVPSPANCPTCGGSNPAAASRASCPTCGGGSAASSGPVQATLVGTVTVAFPSQSVEKEFAQLLGQKEFKGLTDRQTMYAVLEKRENRYLARRMCFLHTPYGAGTSPAYVLVPEEPEDIALLVDTQGRPLSANEFDVVKGRIVGIAPPAMCNAQQLPIVAFHQLYSFRAEPFIKSIPRPDRIKEDEFERACDELFHRAMRVASNATGPMLGLSYAILSYVGLYTLVADKFKENSSLARISVNQSRANPDCADIRLKFVRRDTGFTKTYCFLVNYGGPFQYLEEPVHPCYETSTS
jgi:hypothetical protein